MRRTFLSLVLLLCAFGPAWGQSRPSDWPLATLPLDGLDRVMLDQGSGCPNQPCATKSAPTTRVGQLVQQTTAPLNPFPYQQWIDTSQSPPQLKEYIGATWFKIGTLDPSAGFSFAVPATSSASPGDSRVDPRLTVMVRSLSTWTGI
jgi:hypothetical protein